PSKDVAGQHHMLWTGCKANETSADAYFSGRYNGAFTYYFVKVMRDTKNKLSRNDVIAKMRTLMRSQSAKNPQREANPTNGEKAIVYCLGGGGGGGGGPTPRHYR